MASLGTQAADTLVGVIAGESCQVHASNRSQKPRCLPFLLYGASRDLGLSAAFDGAGVNAHLAHPIEVERSAAVG
jgi:hypothetical protein